MITKKMLLCKDQPYLMLYFKNFWPGFSVFVTVNHHLKINYDFEHLVVFPRKYLLDSF